jgi:hypothetical protein
MNRSTHARCFHRIKHCLLALMVAVALMTTGQQQNWPPQSDDPPAQSEEHPQQPNVNWNS